MLAFTDYKIGDLRVCVEATHFLDHNNGNLGTLGVDYAYAITNKWTMTNSISVTYGDSAHMRENYGVSPQIALLTGKSPYRLHDGFRDVTVATEMEYQADQHWSYSVGLGYAHLLGEAADSTRVTNRSQPYMAMGLRYQF